MPLIVPGFAATYLNGSLLIHYTLLAPTYTFHAAGVWYLNFGPGKTVKKDEKAL